MIKKHLILGTCIFAILASMAGCSKKNEKPDEGSNALETTYTGSATGFGGDVSISLVSADGKVSSVVAKGDSETPDIGGKAIEELNSGALKSLEGKEISSIDVDSIDVVTGATVSSNAVKNALKAAINEATGVQSGEKTPVADGTQEVTVSGHSIVSPMKVSVTFKDNAISEIKVVEHDETAQIFDTVENLFIPRLVENQSLATDAVTGATVSSNAVKTAVEQAINAAGGDSSEWFTKLEKSSETVKLEGYDVIVVGLGGAGMSAYASAAETGATVFGFDTAGKVGGTSSTTSGPMAINPEKKMEIQNNGAPFLNEEELIADWLEYCEGDAKEEIVRLMVDKSGDTMDWLMDRYGFQFGDINSFFHPKMWKVWASYQGDVNAQYASAMEAAKALNEKNDYMLELTATKLLTDENGKINGVQATYYDGTTYEIYGKSVILATGGFAGNRDMMEQYFGETWNTKAMTQNQGAGILMAEEVGAALYNIDVAPMQHNAQTATIIRDDSLTADEKAVLASLVLGKDSMLVNQEGIRFMNEAGNIEFDSWKGGAYFYTLYSEEQINEFKTNGLNQVSTPFFLGQGGSVEAGTPISSMDKILSVGEENGIVFKAETVGDLAELVGMENLVAEVEKYNTYATGEKDPFGKDITLFHEIKLDQPVYAIKGAAYIYGTCGGLDVDANLNVLDTNGNPIEGLYATGLDSMGTILTNKKAYVTYGGAAQGWALTSGMVAGEKAAKAVLETN
ncbi:FAD-binding protein [Lachnoclostridium phytofermentans]|uniref:FAD-binding protein n=1 Tax=Lachnoclostridium phytofermentans TaxID=66219 RepID=UPI000495E64C|nr:FAD-binding protein [Lachnoclostridium phytofermentans]